MAQTPGGGGRCGAPRYNAFNEGAGERVGLKMSAMSEDGVWAGIGRRHWGALRAALGPRLRPAAGPAEAQGGAVIASEKISEADKARLGEALKAGAQSQLGALTELFDRLSAPGGELSYAAKCELRDAETAAETTVAWAFRAACQAGAFEMALEAAEAVTQRRSPLRPTVLPRVLAREAVARGLEAGEASRRLAALAGAKRLWSKDSELALGSEDARSPMGWRHEAKKLNALGEIASGLALAAMEDPAAAEPGARTLGLMRAWDQEGWGAVGEASSNELGQSEGFLERGPGPELLGALPGEFWLAVKTRLGSEAKAAEIILAHLIERAREDGWLKNQLCLSVWSGLSAREIEAFETAFPGESREALGRALKDESALGSLGRGSLALSLGLIPRIKEGAESAAGEWARASVEAAGLGEGSGLAMSGRDPRAPLFFEALQARWQAIELEKATADAEARKGPRRGI